MEGKKKKERKKIWFIEVVGDPSATKSEAARKSMALLASHIDKIKKRPKDAF